MEQKTFLLRLPVQLYNQISQEAQGQGVPLNEYIINRLSPDYNIKKPLIEKIREATIEGTLQEPFATSDLKKWINKYSIKNDRTGNEYTESSINSLLANSSFDSDNKNLNRKVLERKKDVNGVFRYWFPKG